MCPYALLSAVLGIDYLANYECCSILLCVRRVCCVCWRGSEEVCSTLTRVCGIDFHRATTRYI